ncbi:Hpt domain-containing protein [Polaromonas sp. C04]|uniref:hybrid sensor histidine kinase/response regulator n=1 Tax=Polaromonas sp. C04 TaxID=1945857 RepID=UPI00098684BB|nr:Hpt domain-containing protein [Polaromonas sp. C04]OOG50745.1 hybrid sensor histidine kinase/response regulator [Polaromonas sp. C04]
MQFNQAGSAALATDPDQAAHDLGPLAWVLDEIRKSLDGATRSLKRFAREAETARGSNLADIDTGQLRIARQQLHQSVGAMEMVGLGAPAHVLRAMEAAVQRFFQHPELCTDEAATKVERAGFALTEYLQAVLSGRPVSSVALFPQYRDVQLLAGGDRVHPADLWPMQWHWTDPVLAPGQPARHYDAVARSEVDEAVLKIMRSGDVAAAQGLRDLSLSLAAAQTAPQPASFWKICAAYFEALAAKLVPVDIYVKRAASRILLQYSTLARGDQGVSDRLAQDLLFFCAQAVPTRPDEAPALSAVRLAYGLAHFEPVDYEVRRFGRYDPALLGQARKRIETAKESWSALSGGDVSKLRNVADHFNLVSELLVRLHPVSESMAQALVNTVDATVRSGRPPATELAMEVATSILYLEAAFEDMELGEQELGARTARLGDRLERVRNGGQPEPLEPWMEELYRRVSDRQTMGTVVGELRTALSEIERALDQFFRDPRDKTVLRDVPGQFAQMRGVLSVLGLEQASLAVLRMRDSTEQMLVTDIDKAHVHAAGTFDKLGNNLGALGFLIDMLSYQPALAKKLFVYDDIGGELKPLMGRAAPPAAVAPAAASAPVSADLLSQELRLVVSGAGPDLAQAGLTAKLDALAARAALAEQPGLARSARNASAAMSAQDGSAAADAMAQLAAAASPAPAMDAPAVAQPDIEEDDLRGIFLDEAREVLQSGLAAVGSLAEDTHDQSRQTTLRRAFHTLKGSSRMVGLHEFGEAAWAMEQLFNTRLADHTPVDAALQDLSQDVLLGFGRWVEAIATQHDTAWRAATFVTAADALRTENRHLALVLPGDAAAAATPQQAAVPELVAPEVDPDVENTQSAQEAAGSLPAESTRAPLTDFGEIDFAGLMSVSEATLPAPLAGEAVPFDLDSLFSTEPYRETQPPATTAVPEPDEWVAFATALEAGLPAVPAHEPALTGAPAEPESARPEPPLGSEPESPAGAASDEPVKVIGPLRIGIPLFNVYLNEADEWSRRLVTELAEWAMELHQPLPDSTVALAHSLAGSSAAVGFHALSELARGLEHALLHVQLQTRGTPWQGKVFNDAADDIRRLLHQFAAGFLKDPNEEVLLALSGVLAAEPPAEAAVQDTAQEETPAQDAAPLTNVVELGRLAPVPMRFSAPPQTPAETRTITQERHDDIDAVDAVDRDLFPIFEEEAAELLPQLGGALRQWSARPANQGARSEVLRTLHTLKGSARLAGALRLGEMAHLLESDIEHLGTDELQTQQLEPLLARFDAMQGIFDHLRQAQAMAEPAHLLPLATTLQEAAPPATPAAATAVESGTAAAPPKRGVIALPASNVLAPLRQASNHAVRVRSQLLDRLVNQAGEVMITRTRLESEIGQLRASLGDLTGNLDRLRQQLRDIELQAETQMQSRLAQAKDSQQTFDPLEFDRFTRVQELTRMMAESVNDVATVQRSLQRTVEATEDDLNAQARQTRELQRDLLRTRMVEFEGISDRLYRVVRQASKETGRQVKLDIMGGSIEMDRGVLDRMTPAFEHLLRNCVAHGIEDAEVRTRLGKDPVGTITIGLHQAGNDVSVEFRDDGAGLDVAGIREKALAQGLISAHQALSDAEAADFIFMPGFSTAAQVNELAGRGIGMDVVRAEVNALGGRIETTTEAGKGAGFKLVLPLTTAVTQVVMLRTGSQLIGVPSNLVEIVRRATARELQQAYNSGTFDFGGESIPFFWSGALLQTSGRSSETQGKTLPVLVLRSAAQRVALHVDEVLGNQEVVVKNLGPQLSRLPGLAGMTVLASGAAVLIYNPVALASVYGEQARSMSADQAQPDILEHAGSGAAGGAAALALPPQVPLILVVDDSITVRRVTQRLLQREGYRVALAVDGLQALERLAEERPALVLSDIEMPRMDGFDLARNIRGDQHMHDLPIVMITSRIAEKHREHAKQLGVNHYLGKPYSEEELLSLVRRYCATEIPA